MKHVSFAQWDELTMYGSADMKEPREVREYSAILAPYRGAKALGSDAWAAWACDQSSTHRQHALRVTNSSQWVDVGARSVRLGKDTSYYLGSGWNITPARATEWTESEEQHAYRMALKESHRPTPVVTRTALSPVNISLTLQQRVALAVAGARLSGILR